MIGSLAYWGVRTPAEVIKTQVQTGQKISVKDAVLDIRRKENGKTISDNVIDLYKYYGPCLAVDVPFQCINFVLFGTVNAAMMDIGIPATFVTRLALGISCGMIAAGLTCPLDVAKTRLISRDKAIKDEDANNKKREEDNVIIETGVAYTNASSSSLSHAQTPTGSTALLEEEHVEVTHGDIEAEKNKDDRLRNKDIWKEIVYIAQEEGVQTLFLGLVPRLLYTGLANGIRLSVYGTSRMSIMMQEFNNL